MKDEDTNIQHDNKYNANSVKSSFVGGFKLFGWHFTISLQRSFVKWLMATLNMACFEGINYLFD